MDEALLGELVGEEASGADPALPLHEIRGFDSLRHVRLIVALEERIGRPFTDDEVDSLTTVGDVVKLLEQNG